MADRSTASNTETHRPVATLVSHTSVLWDTSAGIEVDSGAALSAGSSIAMFDGQAHLQFGQEVQMLLHGPVMLSITPSGDTLVRYGKARVRNQGPQQWAVRVPQAMAYIPSDSCVGIDAFGDEVVVHALDGDVSLWPDGLSGPTRVPNGKAARLRTDAHSELGVSFATAIPDIFVDRTERPNDQLHISEAYVRLLRQAKPIGFWRFEQIQSHLVRDESGFGRDLRLVGSDVHIVHRGDNGWAEFDVRDQAGCFICDRSFPELSGSDYSIEMWIKPSHYHRGAVVSLIEQADDETGPVERHGLIVETHDAIPVTGSHESRAKAVRFLHRSPPHELLGGSSCFSALPYRSQTWQHVAVVKAAASMRLYIDGELQDSADEATTFPDCLTMVVGQLFSFGTVRPFVGQLDELAVYARALTQDEIHDRIRLVRTTDSVLADPVPDSAEYRLGPTSAMFGLAADAVFGCP